MKDKKKCLTLIVFLCLLLAQAFSASAEVTINYVSSSLNIFTSAQGSKGGGTVIYIAGTNFSPNADDTQVYFGPYPCNLIAKGSTVSMLSCVTSPMLDPNSPASLPVTIYTANLLTVSCTTYACLFTYNDGLTPFINEVFPTTMVGNQMIKVSGIHRISEIGDGRSPSASNLKYILIGDTSCSTLDIIQDLISYNSNDIIFCNTFLNQEAGEYNVTERIIYGDARFSFRNFDTSFFTGINFNVRITPFLTPNTIQKGGALGHLLTFSGTGFSSNPANLTNFTCSIGAVSCSVIANPQGFIQVQLPPYKSGYETNGILTKDAADLNPQQNPYLGSYGFRYTRFNKTSPKTLDQLLLDMRVGNNTEAIVYDGYQTQLSFMHDGTINYDDYLRGYFYAAVDGAYNFETTVDDCIMVYLSKVQGSSNPSNMVQIMRVDTYLTYQQDPYNTIGIINTATVNLKKGYYYMEVIARGAGSYNYYYVSVSMPPIDITKISTIPIPSKPTLYNPTWKIENVLITPTSTVPQIITITVDTSGLTNATTTYTLYYYSGSGTSYSKVTSPNIPIKATLAQFTSAIKSFGQFASYNPTFTMTMLDINGNVTSLNTTATKYVYNISYQLTRGSAYATLPYTSISAVTAFTAQAHSSGIAGTYVFRVDGVAVSVYDSMFKTYSTTIQSTNSLGYLQTALRTLYNAPELEIISRNTQQLPDQLSFNILYFGVSNPKTITIDTSAMTGGTNDKLNVTITTLRNLDLTRPYFNAIPYEFLRMATSLPTLIMKYNGIPAICVDCFYQYQAAVAISVSAAQFKTSKLGLNISLVAADPTILLGNISLSDITITLYGQPCNIDSNSTTSALLCTFNTVLCGGNTLPKIPAGNEPPKVHIRQYGFANSTLSLKNDLKVTSVSPLQLGMNGGVTVTATGTGFPQCNPSQLTITAANTAITGGITISSVTACQAQFNFALQNSSIGSTATTTLTYNVNYPTYSSNLNDLTNTFTLNSALDPSVTAMSINSASPILKQNIVITGTNFDLNATKMKVYLYFASNLTQKYELGILSVASSTSMTCVLGGGRTGDYYLRVLVVGKGMSAPSPASLLSYEIVVNSISPITGSIGGGFVMTINGANFATGKGSTQVFIGDGLQSLCNILTITSTTITCTVPTIDSTYLAGDTKTVLVTGRLIELSRCKGTCGFSYNTLNTIYVSLSTSVTDFKAGAIVTITTTSNFIVTPVVTVGTVTVTLLTIQVSQVTFAYPALPAGSYPITVSVSGVNAYPILQTTTSLSIGAISSTAGSNLGQILFVLGNGFTSITDPNNVIYYNCSATPLFIPILSITPTNVTFEIPSNPNLACSINVTMGLNFSLNTYTQSTAKTPFIVVTDLGSLSYKIVASNNNSKGIKFIVARYLNSNGLYTKTLYTMTWTTTAANTYTATPANGYLPAGTFVLSVQFDTLGYADSTTNQFTISPTSINALTPTPTTASFGGQGSFSLTSSGFITNNIQNNQITVCGIRTTILSASQTALTFQIPAFVNAQTRTQYGLGIVDILTSKGNTISDTVVKTNFAFDNNTKTFYSSTNSLCYTGLDFGAGAQGMITQIRYMPNPAWIRMDNYFDGAVFEGSNDNTAWTTIFAIDAQLVHTGWNVWLDSTGTNIYRYVRFRQTNGLSSCQLAQLEFSGIIYSTQTYTSTLPCPVSVNLYGVSKSYPSLITYSNAATSVITNIAPAFGPSTGSTLVTITGTGFSTTSISIMIDGIACTIITVTSTTITCTTGPRLTPPSAGNSFVVTSAGYIAILNCGPFLYMDRWSSSATWGGEVPPREGDTVYVPPGMTLLVDQSTPYLNTIMVEGGKIVFSDEIDMTVDANYFILIGGEFRAGLPSAPYRRKLTITLHGGYYDKQLPYFGNKVLGCMNCKFNMHGAVRTPTWTEITSTIIPGDIKLNLLSPVDWVVGQSIAVAATGYNHFESEQKTIVAVSADFKTITVDTPFLYRHFSGTESYGGKNFVMNAEVGLLTRNIVIQGDDMTDLYNHGSHLIFMGKAASGLDATLSYTEIRKCGQPKIVARYCSHFHLAGQVPNSFVRGIAVHHSHARVLTIHGTHYLTVEKNVGYLVKGHNIFIEDGIQTRNIIQNNLMISTIASQTMLQSDTSPAGYWITNPLNTVINNRAAGGDFYGFWYEIKPNPDGPSATPNICPIGMRLGQSSNNVAHSQRKFGLRIFNYAARQYPCLPIANQGLVNPFDANPAFESIFDNYLLWKNQQNGVLGEQLGFVTLSNFLIIDSGQSGMEFYQANLTLQNVTAKKSIIVGFSTGNSPDNLATLRNVRGIITPRTDGFRADDITFANFGPLMTPLKSCSKCQSLLFQVTGGKTSFFNNIKYSNIQGNYIYWNNWRREIFIDEDGSLTKPITTALGLPNGKFGGVTPYFDHLNIPNFCYNIVSLWDNSSFCNENITLRSLLYTNADPYDDFVGQTIRTFKMNSLSDSDKPNTYDVQPQIVIKKSHDIKNSWAFPYAVGYNYHTHFQYGIDFLHLSLAPGQYWLNNEAIVLKFNYTDQRELYKIGHYYAQKLQTPLITGLGSNTLSAATCQNGDFYHNQTTRNLYVCVSGRNKTLREWIDITGVRCNNTCPKADPFSARETFVRNWSNTTQWPNATLPKAGANVTIPYEWNIILDLSPPAFNYVLINGLLYFGYKDLTFQANTIWVQQGGIFIGSPAQPYTYQATIILNGNFNDTYTVLDPGSSGNKMLAVTGALEFYGSPPNVTWTRLAAIAAAGSNTIIVQDFVSWKVGNEIVIGATYSGQTEDQVFKIISISGTTITLNGSLTYQHYGAQAPITNVNGGVIDTRAAVGLLTRNIKITRGSDVNNWGCRVQVYSYLMQFTTTTPPIPVNGRVYFDGVELDGCGQYGSSNAGLRIQKLGSIVNTDYATVVTRSTIRNCNGYCVYIDKSSNVTFDNNVIHFGRRYLVYVLKVYHYSFINNVMLGLRMRPQVVAQGAGTGLAPNNAAYQQFVPVNSDTDNITVTNNLVQGSEDNGFVFPFTSCAKINTYPFSGNTAGSCFAAFITNVNPGFLCLAASGFTGYASYIGFIANPPGFLTQVQYTNMYFTDNQRAFTLRFAHQIDDNTMMLNDSYFMGYSRPSCPSCYSNTKLSYCNDGYAIRMFTATLSGQFFPFNKNITGFDVICTQEAFDAKAFLKNVTFQNYKYGANSEVPYCTKMNVFRKHDGASDATASHHLYNTSCVNCDLPSLVYFSPSNPSWRGWAGGCGQLDCTGSINYFIHDHTGHYTTSFNNYLLQPTQLLANNQPVGGNETACARVNQWNGYWCKFEELAVLEYQSIAADYNKRMVWPIYLNYDGGNWNSTTNGWKQWEWIAPGDPAERRLARFWSVVRISKVYNMTYSSQPPSDSVYQIQKRQLPTGNPNDWVIIKIYFPVPNVVIVRVTNTTKANILVPGYQQLNGVFPDLKLSTGICGANYYQFDKNVINFVVNGKNNCQVRLTLSSYVQLTVRFLIDITSFFTNNGPTTMLTNIIAFLNIDPSQIKIVSINAGSSGLFAKSSAIQSEFHNATFKASTSTTDTVITLIPGASLSTNTVITNASDPTSGLLVSGDKNSSQDSNELTSNSNKLVNGLRSNTIAGLPTVASVDTTMSVIGTNGTTTSVCPPTYLYNSTKKACYCDAGYIEYNLTCIACSAVGNSTATVNPNITNRCICKSTFVWSNVSISCVCPGAQDIIDIGGTCFSCIALKNGTGLIDTMTACACYPTFGFNKTARACQCPDPQSYLLNNTCIGCTGFVNGTGKVAKTPNCQCLPTFVYDNTTQKCICSANSVLLPNQTCLKCATGLVYKPQKLACLCPIDNSAYLNGTCIPCNAANMTGTVITAGNQCTCIATYVWKNNACQCNDVQSVIISGACVSCSGTNFNLSGAGVVNGTSCGCKTGFTWLPDVGKCVCGVNSVYYNGNCYNCATYNNTVVSRDSSLTACSCVNNLAFNTSKLICDCSNNSIIVQSTCVDCTSTTIRGVARVSINTCSCATTNNFVWSAPTQACICNSGYFISGTSCVKCSTIPFSTASSSLGVSCVCQATFNWNPTSLTCVCDANSVLGPIVSNTQKCLTCNVDLGASGIDPKNSSQCLCLGSLIWDSTKKLCVCYILVVPTAAINGTNSTNSTNATVATTNYAIIAPDAKCIPCSNITDINIVNPPVDSFNCKCVSPFFWDNIQMKCVSCILLENGVGKINNQELSCSCKSGYYFDIYTNRCLHYWERTKLKST